MKLPFGGFRLVMGVPQWFMMVCAMENRIQVDDDKG